MTKPVLLWHFPARRLNERGTDLHFTADAVQLKTLADAYHLISAERFEARITIRSWRGRDGLRLDGHLDAEVTQSCVVTLDPVASAIRSEFSRRYLSGEAAESSEIIVEVESEDPPENWNGREIDLGAVIEEEFVLNLDPYPRKI